jgi:anti-sigma regulatory factor (Ser/Thr protein kinase)
VGDVTGTPLVCPIAERSQVGEARRRVAQFAGRWGLGDVARERLALVVSELGTNLVKHGGGGDLIVRRLGDAGAVQVLALDKGGGMASVDECFRDGYSTAGSAGTGLGAVRRLASRVDVYSQRGAGTAIVAEVAVVEPPPRALPGWQVGAVSLPRPGEEVCGDGWSTLASGPEHLAAMVVDGLGHGPGAAEAARAAVRAFEAHPSRTPSAHLSGMHDALRSTRGAAAAVACIDRASRAVTFAGVGNIAAAIAAGAGTRRLVSMSGTLGHQAHRFSEFTYPWAGDAVLVMHSDGLATRWDLDRYPGLAARHPVLLAGVLFRDFQRGRDDVTVLAVRATPP